MKIAVIGKNGFIGSHLSEYLSSDFDVTSFGRLELDITKESDIKNFFKAQRFDVIILAAASKDVKHLESDEDYAYDINVKPVELFLKYLTDEKFIFFSTDYVFNGKKGSYEDSENVCPDSVYGKTKVSAENLIFKSNKNCLILRTAAVMGKGSVFFDWLLSALNKECELHMFSNSYFSPTCITFICETVQKIIEQDCDKKLLHLVQEERLSRCELAVLVQDILKTQCKIVPGESNFKDLSLVQSEYVKKLNMGIFRDYLRKEIANV